MFDLRGKYNLIIRKRKNKYKLKSLDYQILGVVALLYEGETDYVTTIDKKG